MGFGWWVGIDLGNKHKPASNVGACGGGLGAFVKEDEASSSRIFCTVQAGRHVGGRL